MEEKIARAASANPKVLSVTQTCSDQYEPTLLTRLLLILDVLSVHYRLAQAVQPAPL